MYVRPCIIVLQPLDALFFVVPCMHVCFNLSNFSQPIFKFTDSFLSFVKSFDEPLKEFFIFPHSILLFLSLCGNSQTAHAQYLLFPLNG